MNNYRITFSLPCIDINYWDRSNNELQAESSLYTYKFKELPDLYSSHIQRILSKAKELGIEDIWYFFEPYAEVTWLCDDENIALQLLSYVQKYCEKWNMDGVRVFTPEDGNFGEWFCNSEVEREFGAKRYSLCRKYAELEFQYGGYVFSEHGGKGRREQIKRTIHGLCNPLGLNYLDEAYICFSRGLICLLFRFFSFKRAVWIYKNIFRQKY